MKTKFYLTLFVFIFTSCLPKAGQSGDVFETLSEYTNQYTPDGLLEKVILHRYEGIGKSKDLLFNSESLYTYEDNALKEIRELRILEDGSRILESLHLYKEGIEEVYMYDKDEVSSYRLSEYDPEKRMRREVRKNAEINYPEFDFIVANDDYEEIFFYNNNDEIIHEIKYDYSKRVCLEIFYFYDQPKVYPKEADARGLPKEQLTYIYVTKTEIEGDKEITHLFMNNELKSKTVKTVEGGIEKEFLYDRGDNLLAEIEHFSKDGFDVEVTYLHDFLRTDSIYSEGDKEIRTVTLSPEEKIITVRTYDEQGNIIKEKTKMEFFSIL